MNVVQAISEVMRSVSSVAKKDRNQHQGFNFRGIDAVVNAVGPALREHGVVVVPEVQDYQYGTVTVGQGAKERQMGHARLTVAYIFYGPDGDSIRTVTAGEAFDSGDKATPKAMSVAFRTALLQALALPTDEPDPDSESHERAAPGHRRQPPAGPTDADTARDELRAVCEAKGVTLQSAVVEFRKRHKAELKDSTDVAAIRALAAEYQEAS